MTGYTVNTGSTQKFSEGWDRIFSGPVTKKAVGEATEGKTGKKVTSKQSAQKSRTSGKK